MCILFIAARAHPQYPLLIAANRDEYHDRRAAPMHYWDDSTAGILAGRDKRAGGTWFGVNRRGRVAAVTNHRGVAVAASASQSRGALVARFLNDESASEFDDYLRRAHRNYPPFHLLYGDAEQLHCFSGADGRRRAFGVGFHALGNGAVDDSRPKMSRGTALLRAKINAAACAGNRDLHRDEFADSLRELMLDETADAAAVDAHRSSIFVRGEDFGTRATTLLLAAADAYYLYEYNYRADGEECARREFCLPLHGVRPA